MEYDNSNRGVLFKNDKKEKETHSDYNGSWTDDNGKEYWLNCWIKTSKNGRKFLSLSATAKQPKPEQQQQQNNQSPTNDLVDSDIPF